MRRFVILARRSLLHQCSLKLLDLRSSLFTLGRVKVNFALLSLNQSLSAPPGLANAVAEGTVAHGGGIEDDRLEFR